MKKATEIHLVIFLNVSMQFTGNKEMEAVENYDRLRPNGRNHEEGNGKLLPTFSYVYGNSEILK